MRSGPGARAVLPAAVAVAWGLWFWSGGALAAWVASLLIGGVAFCGAIYPAAGLYGRTVRRGPSAGAAVALTFDDGPHPVHTRQVLDLLDDAGAKGTFFVVGERVDQHPDVVAEVVRRGHEVAPHSHRHRWQTLWTARAVFEDLREVASRIETHGGGRSPWFRPPIGIVAPTTYAAAAAAGCEVVAWSIRSLDGRGSGPEAVAERVLSNVGAGDIVLLHDSPLGLEPGATPAAIEALPRVLAALQERGLRSVTMSELLGPSLHTSRPPAGDLRRRPIEWIVGLSLALLLVLGLVPSVRSAVAAPAAEVASLPESFRRAADQLGARRTVRASFVHEKFSPLFIKPVRRTGSLELRTADRRVLWAYDDGTAILMADGRFYPAFRTEAEAGRVGTAGFALPGGTEQVRLMQGLFGVDPAVLGASFDARELQPGTFELVPRAASARALFKSVTLTVGGTPLVLQRVEMAEATGDRSVLTFENTVVDSAIAEDRFYTPAERSAASRAP